jgi:hypothetical protein
VEALAIQSLKRAIDRRGWKVEDDGALFDAGALLALGDGSHVCMADATARHLGEHRALLDENNRRQNSAYEAKRSQIDEWLPALFQRRCTLGYLMARGQDAEAAA